MNDYPTIRSGKWWHWLLSLIFVIGGLVLFMSCSGCMPTAAELNAIARDHAEVDIDITLPWGSVHFHRKNPFLFAPTTQPAIGVK